jgi:hypothetical protein
MKTKTGLCAIFYNPNFAKYMPFNQPLVEATNVGVLDITRMICLLQEATLPASVARLRVLGRK